MEGRDNIEEIKAIKDHNYILGYSNKPALNTISNISDMSKEIQGANDSSLECLAEELFREDGASHNSSNKKK